MNPKIAQGLALRDRARLAASGAPVDAIKAVDAKIAALKDAATVKPAPVALASVLAPDFNARHGKHKAFAELDAILAAAAVEPVVVELAPIEKITAGLAARAEQRAKGAVR